jgi:indole-3-glycerol phosphate synthase
MSTNDGNFLARMATSSHRRLNAAMARAGERELRRRVKELPPPPKLELAANGFDLIAEIKRRSPSAGDLAAQDLAIAAQARAYTAGGACALSVLTEPEEFSGELSHLTEVAVALPQVPVMRKDFLVGTYQVLEARAAGASGVLLIAAILEPDLLEAMLAHALELGLFVLVEVFDEGDIARCAGAMAAMNAPGRLLIGVNCRDLRTLGVDRARFAALAPYLPGNLPWVAESGIETAEQAAEVARLGYRVALVGTALMRSGAPEAAARELIKAGRGARS